MTPEDLAVIAVCAALLAVVTASAIHHDRAARHLANRARPSLRAEQEQDIRDAHARISVDHQIMLTAAGTATHEGAWREFVAAHLDSEDRS